jgi:hypothetical protein
MSVGAKLRLRLVANLKIEIPSRYRLPKRDQHLSIDQTIIVVLRRRHVNVRSLTLTLSNSNARTRTRIQICKAIVRPLIFPILSFRVLMSINRLISSCVVVVSGHGFDGRKQPKLSLLHAGVGAPARGVQSSKRSCRFTKVCMCIYTH